jgi:hypothetical protein
LSGKGNTGKLVEKSLLSSKIFIRGWLGNAKTSNQGETNETNEPIGMKKRTAKERRMGVGERQGMGAKGEQGHVVRDYIRDRDNQSSE